MSRRSLQTGVLNGQGRNCADPYYRGYAMELGISTTATSERSVIKVSGEVDISNADALRDAINLAMDQAPGEVRLDFANVAYIDSTGVGVLVGAARSAEEHAKQFSVVRAQPTVMRVVQLLGVDGEINISAA